MTTFSFTTAELDSTEQLAVAITKELFVSGDIDEGELEHRMASILGLNGKAERERVLHTDETVDITGFGSPWPLRYATAWAWPDSP